jgi:hypothetical protein
MNHPPINPKLDLAFTRNVDVRPALIWRAWATLALLQ